LRRRFSAVAYDLELDLLTFIERGQTRPLHSRNVHKHILPAALRLDESIAFGRIKPLHSPSRHQSSPRGKRGRCPNLHILVTAARQISHITNGLVRLIPRNLLKRWPAVPLQMEYQANMRMVRERTERLKALRLAREAADKERAG